MTFEVGYRRPPLSGQFKSGVSGNPKGRPKGSKNFATLLEKELLQQIVVTENGKKRSLTRLQALAKKLVSAALQEGPKSQLALVDVMRRTGLLDAGPVEDAVSLLPDNYRELLNAYVQKKAPAGATTTAPSKEKPHGNE
jgi:hypothetical protein